MNVATATRFARQLALPEVGADGQERLGAARAVVVGDGLGAETAARYLAAAGVGALRILSAGETWPHLDEALRGSNPDVTIERGPRPADGRAWMAALEGVAIVVRADLDDDALLPAAIRRGVPLVVLRGQDGGDGAVDVVSFRKHGPCPHAPLDVPRVAAVPAPEGAARVVAGTAAAAEALHVLVAHDVPARAARARHLRVPLDGGDPVAQDLPWTPECFACGGSGSEMSFQ
ncbi:MAG TPA: ThiF family adenylyltransferase [Polyangia bacterium]|nr:ThiF family adenylyltransferase [Polyangia bacterium]